MTQVHLEMDCIHDQVKGTMTCEWLHGRIKIVVDWVRNTMVILKDGEVKDRRTIEGMSIDEFVRIEEQQQYAAEQLAHFEEPAYEHV